MTPQYLTARIWTKTLKKLRLIAALTDDTIVAVMERLAAAELAKIKKAGHEDLK
jgi:hypothetical protein